MAANVALPSRGANSAPQIPQLNLRGYFVAGEREGSEGKEKGQK